MPPELIIYIVLYGLWFGLVLYRTKIAVFLLPLFFPLYLVRFEIFNVPVYFVEGLILLSAIPIFYQILIGESKKIIKKKFHEKIIFIFGNFLRPRKKAVTEFLKSPFLPVVLFLIACTISAVIVPGDASLHALGILKSWVIIPIIFFVILYRSVKSSNDVSLAMYAYMASALFLSFWALYQEFSGQFLTVDFRVSGPFESANYFTMYIAPAIIFGGVRFIKTFIHKSLETADMRWNSFERRIFLGCILAVLFVALILAQSYAGIFGVFITLVLYIIYELNREKERKSHSFLKRLIIYALLFFILGGSIAVSLNIEKFQNLIKFDERTSISTRLEIWKVGSYFIKENPIIGIGLGQFQHLYIENAEQILNRKPFEEVRLHSHNVFMETWLNSGLLGIISFIWIIYIAFMQLKKKLSGRSENLRIAGYAMLTYLILHGLIDVTFWKNDLALIFWLTMGIIFSLTRISKKFGS